MWQSPVTWACEALKGAQCLKGAKCDSHERECVPQLYSMTHWDRMLNFFLPNSRIILPTFSTYCPDGSHIAQMGLMGSHFAHNTTTNPCSLFSIHRPLLGKTPPTPPQNTPFPGVNLKVGKINYRLGRMDPNSAKCLKSGQNVSRSGQKK